DTFKYVVTDGQGDIAGPATVTITINPVNDAPFAQPDAINVQIGVPTFIPYSALTSNDVEIDAGDSVNPDSVQIEVSPIYASLVHVTINGVDGLQFTTGHLGNDIFQYSVEDSNGARSVPVAVVVNATITAPTSMMAPMSEPSGGTDTLITDPDAVNNPIDI
ncbi:MAG: hypothetical protein KAT71_04280, partial [Gammaproteobacteria bacterium]|nr:hypothetical protein [Gammaproteobacteria bacterium]